MIDEIEMKHRVRILLNLVINESNQRSLSILENMKMYNSPPFALLDTLNDKHMSALDQAIAIVKDRVANEILLGDLIIEDNCENNRF